MRWGAATFVAALLIAALEIAFAVAARAGDGPDFRLDLDTGGHMARISDLAFTPDGTQLVSASDDKTIRVWDWQSGVTLRIIRGYIGANNDGKVFAVAVSPDGKTIAAGGYFGAGLGEQPPYGDVRLFDMATGRMLAALKGADYAVYDLAFSPDGQRLAAGGGDGFVFLWRRDPAAAAGWSLENRLDANSWHIDKLAFAANGTRLAATTTDNGIRLWSLPDAGPVTLPAQADALSGVSVGALAVSQDGALFATGSEAGDLDIWRAADGTLVRALPKQDFLIGSLTFAADGRRLVASCGYRCADRNRTVLFDTATGAVVSTYFGHDGTVFASTANADGSLVATGGGTRHAIQVWDPLTGERRALLQGAGSPVTAVGIAPDGGSVAWGSDNPCPERVSCPDAMGTLVTKLVLPAQDRFFDDPRPVAPDETYARAEHAMGGWRLAAKEGGKDGLENALLELSRDGKVLHTIENGPDNGYVHSAFTLTTGGSRLITGGSDGTMLEYETGTARVSGEFVGGHTGEVHAMAAVERAGLLVTGSADQTLKLWNLDTRELIVSMVFAGQEWIAWTPQGYYYSSPDGDKLIGWQVNQGRDHEGRFVRGDQLKKYLWSPELVRRAIILKSASAAVKEMRPGIDNQLKHLLEKKPPEFQMRLADDQSKARPGFVTLEITGAREAGVDVSDLAILSNSRNVGQFTARDIGAPGSATTIEVPVEDGANTIQVTATNSLGYVTERSVTALVRKAEREPRKGKLYVAVIGVDKYPYLATACSGGPCDLRYPVDDATAFLKIVRERTAPLFSAMAPPLVLVNQDAEPAGAVGSKPLGLDTAMEPDADTIDDQLADFLDQPTEDDTTIVFIAGHGINVDEDYYFIPTDGRKQGEDRWKRSSLVDWADIQKSLERAKGMRLMVVDTCHAAGAFNPRLQKEAQDARIVVFSATAANNTAAELPSLGHGVFTFAMIEGLKGKAKTSDSGVTLLGLADFIGREVERLTQQRQKPAYYLGGVENIVLAEP